jgi:heptosyltransferase III
MHVTLVHTGALGDTIVLLPLLRAIRAKWPGARITLVMRPAFGQMFLMWEEISDWQSIDEAAASRWFGTDTDAQAMPWSDCDVLISAVSNGDDAWAANARRLSTAKQILFFDPRPPEDFAGHVTAFQRGQLAALELPEVGHPPVSQNPDGALLIHPGSGGEAKCWPRECFLTLARDLKRNGILPTFLLGEAEQERWGRSAIEALKDEFPWYLHMGLYELSERMRRGRLYIGNDSGVSHMAGAVGVPSLVLFGPSNDVQWRPWGPAVRVVRAGREPGNLEALGVSEMLGVVMEEMRRM